MNIQSYFKTNNAITYNCDNLELLKELPSDYINLIYCDILYGTGRNFGDYQDLKPDRKIIEDFYIPRLTEMHRVLKNTGSIYIQMDYRVSHWIRVILDSIFGYENFVNEIIWHYSKMNAVNNKFIGNHDNIFVYSKSNIYTFNVQYNEAESALKQRLNKFIKNNKIMYKDVKYHKSQLMDNYINSTKNRLHKTELDDNDIVLDFENKGKQKSDDVWNIPIIKGNSLENYKYPTQKPKELLERIVKASSNENDIVADFFMGSGTTGEVAVELERKFIGCDISEKACKISQNRIINIQNKTENNKM